MQHINELKETDGALGSSLDKDVITEKVNARLEAIASELDEILTEYSAHVRPHEAAKVAGQGISFAEISHESAGETFVMPELGYQILQDNACWVESIGPNAMGQLLLNMPITEMCDPETPLDKHLAVEIANELGPDWAQAWYRFIVLVTKLA